MDHRYMQDSVPVTPYPDAWRGCPSRYEYVGLATCVWCGDKQLFPECLSTMVAAECPRSPSRPVSR